MDAEHQARHEEVAVLRQMIQSSKYKTDAAVQNIIRERDNLKRMVITLLPPDKARSIFAKYDIEYPD